MAKRKRPAAARWAEFRGGQVGRRGPVGHYFGTGRRPAKIIDVAALDRLLSCKPASWRRLPADARPWRCQRRWVAHCAAGVQACESFPCCATPVGNLGALSPPARAISAAARRPSRGVGVTERGAFRVGVMSARGGRVGSMRGCLKSIARTAETAAPRRQKRRLQKLTRLRASARW